MKTEIDTLSSANLIAHQSELCRLALNHMGDSGSYETWSGKYGQVIVDDAGHAWAGDLCYMIEKFGWTHEQYMAAYGSTGRADQVYLTDRLQLHTAHDGKHLLVIPLGGDGCGPLGLGFDTGSCSFVTTDRARAEAMQSACIAHMEGLHSLLETEQAAREAQFATFEKEHAARAERRAKWETPGNTVRGTRSVAAYAGGGYRGRPRFKTETEQVEFVIAKASADYLTSTQGARYKRATLDNCHVFTRRQIGAEKAARTRKASILNPAS